MIVGMRCYLEEHNKKETEDEGVMGRLGMMGGGKKAEGGRGLATR